MAANTARTPELLVPQLEELIGYIFDDKMKAWEALNCKGALFWQHSEGNKRLALLGDTIVRWFLNGNLPTQVGNDEAAQVASNSNLTALGMKIGLNRLIIPNISQGNVVSGGQVADAMEAVVGAVFADGGETSLPGVMQKLGLV